MCLLDFVGSTVVRVTLRCDVVVPRVAKSEERQICPHQSQVGEFLNFLKTCHMCKKQLIPQEDICMYRGRGDQSFCSVKWRCRQILLDEMKELEAFRKQMLANSGLCGSGTTRLAQQSGPGRSRRIPAAAA
ncbi:PREDICTED: uncharacterized protein LOC109115561 [Nelumbo nucifera]|uniref:Uncharacterized protein LOC109115561 n=1 Tax=Nelumbo nucifera TaxID=4432 RepID=A0A1U8Q9Q1_NELNU|nr:PREDICTED: uncharacterized protein LOC109115561 [Nelumbo nucifera]